MPDLQQRLEAQRTRIAQAALRSGRAPEDVTLVAVTKGHPADRARAALDAGHPDLGESYVQEWRRKAAELAGWPVRWHFVGHLQSNKARALATGLTLLHSVDRTSLVEALERHVDGLLDVLVQVNVAAEDSKFGCPPDQAPALVRQLADSSMLRPRGLMTIAPQADDPEAVRPVFRGLRELRDRLRDDLADRPDVAETLTELSMGMSDDLEVAVEEGATIVRVGTAVFGPRPR